MVYKKKRSYKKKPKTVTAVIVTKKRRSARSITSGKTSTFKQSFKGMYRYVDKISGATNLGGVTCGVYTFRLNSAFDVDFTGFGHQPLFRDVMAGIYARYRVDSVDYRVTPLNYNSNNLLYGIMFTQDSGFNPAGATFAEMLEKRNMSKYELSTVNSNATHLTGRVQMHQIAAVSKKQYEDERDYSAAIGSNPNLPVFMHILFQDFQNASASFNFMVEFNMNTTYYEPVVQGQN